MDTLTRDDHGTFLIETASGSTYRVVNDADASTMVRIPATEPTLEIGEVSHLRRDEEVLNIIAFTPVQVGSPAGFALSPLSDNGADVTFRRTTRVTSIRQAA